MAGVMRVVEEALLEGFCCEHLSARRPEGVVELRQQAATRSVGCDDDLFRLKIVERSDAFVLSECDTCLRRESGEPMHEARRLQGSVAGMEDRAAKVGTQLR